MAAKPQQVTSADLNFGDLGMYSGGNFIPDGSYILFFNVVVHQAVDKAGVVKGAARLGVMVDFFAKENPTEDSKLNQFYSMGSKAIEMFLPNPDTGKGVRPKPGAQGGGFNDQTNWALFLKSLYDSGLPPGVFSNDVTVLDGVHVHITNVDEPAERSTFQSATAEVQQERRKNKIAVVSEILEGGMPWEGGGGMEAPAAPAPAAKAPAKTAPKAAPKASPAPAAAPAAADDDGDIRTAAISAISNVIEKAPNGLPRLKAKTDTFAEAKKLHGDEIASKVIAGFFDAGKEDDLNGLLGELGYQLASGQIKPLTT